MNKALKYASLLALSIVSQAQPSCNSDCSQSCDTTSKTYFSVRPQFQVGSPEYLTLTRGRRTIADCKWGGSLLATVFGGQSTDRRGMGTYFMPFGSPSAEVNGTISEGSNALLPQNFNIFSVKYSPVLSAIVDPATTTEVATPYQSTICLKPHQSVVGVGLAWDQGFSFKDYQFFVTISGPVMNVSNSMNLCESVVSSDVQTVEPLDDTNLETPQTSMKAALAQDAWCFGKIACKDRSRTELAFIQVRLGYVSQCNKHCGLESYVGMTIPTGNKPHASHMFNPVVGNGGHFGLLWGSSAWMKLWKWSNMHFSVSADMVSQYLFNTTQKRSFDLKNKPWSRYVELYSNSAQALEAYELSTSPATVPQSAFLGSAGINTLTGRVDVDAGFNFTSNVALLMMPCHKESGFNAEIGYNFYARQAECIKLKNNCPLTAAIKSVEGMGIVNPMRDITGDEIRNEASYFNDAAKEQLPNQANNQIPDLPFFVSRQLKTSDLDLQSATHPCTLSHTFYGNVGYAFNKMRCPIICGLGGSYEFTDRNTSLERWMIWGKIGFSY